jgi:hypothetical protein
MLASRAVTSATCSVTSWVLVLRAVGLPSAASRSSTCSRESGGTSSVSCAVALFPEPDRWSASTPPFVVVAIRMARVASSLTSATRTVRSAVLTSARFSNGAVGARLAPVVSFAPFCAVPALAAALAPPAVPAAGAPFADPAPLFWLAVHPATRSRALVPAAASVISRRIFASEVCRLPARRHGAEAALAAGESRCQTVIGPASTDTRGTSCCECGPAQVCARRADEMGY